MNDFEALVSLNIIPQIGSARLASLLQKFSAPANIFKASREDLISAVGENLAQSILAFKPALLKKDFALAKKLGIKIITCFDAGYPALLKEIPGRPIVLYISGSFVPVDNLAIGIVGSRRASFYGLNSTQSFASQLSLAGVTIVSGLARGVDTCAHKAALKAGGRTLAVIGSGFCHIYPEENLALAKSIAANGAVISEFSMETLPLAQNFPRRNRIISGLSLGVLVTEAARNSGALITADFALEQGREVFALPGRIDALGSMGANALLKQGAKMVTCCEDILEELNLPPEATSKVMPDAQQLEINSSVEENKLYACISNQPESIDDLIQKSALSSAQVLGLILKLQFKKQIQALPGKQFVRS